MGVQENYNNLKKNIPQEITLVAVSKTKPIEDIQALYEIGVRDFGENKIQEMCDKYAKLPKDIRWHMIGHVQSNKVKYMADFVHLIHGVHSPKLLKEISKKAIKAERVQEVLLQVKIAEEESKQGMSYEEAHVLLREQNKYPGARIIGLMGMATFTQDSAQVRGEFSQLHKMYQDLQKDFPQLKTLSMGMSGDYTIAMEEGSTMLRVGSKIFGERNYK